MRIARECRSPLGLGEFRPQVVVRENDEGLVRLRRRVLHLQNEVRSGSEIPGLDHDPMAGVFQRPCDPLRPRAVRPVVADEDRREGGRGCGVHRRSGVRGITEILSRVGLASDGSGRTAGELPAKGLPVNYCAAPSPPMPTLSSLSLPPPRNWQDFEDLCCDLWRRLWADPMAQKNGRSGQPQAGVDVFGRPNAGDQWEGVQCKLKANSASLTRKEIEIEVERAKTFEPALSKLLIATTAPRAANTQKVARQITAAQLKKGSFPVGVVFWEDILLHLASFPDLVAKHFPITNIIVQKVGDGHEPISGYAHITLTRFLNARITTEKMIGLDAAAALLSPYAASVALVGRDDVLADFWAWMQKEGLVSFRVLTAPAGMGKTRLALDLCEAAVQAGWVAGFLLEPELTRFRSLQNLSTWGWSRPTLIAIDYAASQARLLRDWLTELADHSGQETQPLRILLLERHADPTAGWWREAFGSGSWHDEVVQALIDPPSGPYTLSPLTDPGQRRAVVTSIIERTGSLVRPPEPGVSRDFDRRLTEISWGGEPLFLLMAGLVAARAGFGEVLTLSATDLAFRIADHEIHRIETIARSRGVPEAFLTHLAACATLHQGLSQTDAEAVIDEEKEALRYRSAGDIPSIYEALTRTLPDGKGSIGPVLPDIVGEALILRTLGERSAESALAAVSRAARKGSRVTATLIHLAQDFGEDPIAQPKVLAWFERVTAEKGACLDSLGGLLDQFPRSTLALREQAATLTARAVELARKQDSRELLAAALHNLAVRLGDLGRREEALTAIEEAVTILRDLAVVRPDALRPSLARSLNNLAIALSALGRREEALAVIEEALAIRRDLAATRPDISRPDLSESLNNQSVLLQALGRREEALMASEEAVELDRNFAAARADVFRPKLAVSLNNLAVDLNALGRREEALTAVEEQVEILRELAAAHSDSYRPNLANALNNLSFLLSGLGRSEEALTNIEEAVAIREDLARVRPDAFWPDLAMSLNNLGLRLTDMGRREEALAASGKATDLYRNLTTARPDAFRPDLARSLHNLATGLSNLGRREEALAAIEEAVAIRRDLATARPDAFRPDLARSLNSLAVLLHALGRREEALEASEEAAELYHHLAAVRPDAFRPGLASSLKKLATHLSDIGRKEEALTVAEEALTIQRDLVVALPDAFRPGLASTLNELAIRLSDMGRREEALAISKEAVELYRCLAATRLETFRPDLASSLGNLSLRLGDLGSREEAVGAGEEAVSILRDLAAALPDAFRPDLARELNNLSISLGNLGRREVALAAGEEAADLYRLLAAARPDAFRSSLAMSLSNLSALLSNLGQRDEALMAGKEATDLYRLLAAMRPDVFQPDLARSLNNLSASLSNLGRREEALAAIEEAVGIVRSLAAARPDVFRPELAMSLNNLAVHLNNLSRAADALIMIEEATELYRHLAAARPNAFRPNLATSLNNLACQFSDLDRTEEAIAVSEEAVAIQRDLAMAQCEAFQPDLAASLNNLSLHLSRLSRSEEALSAGEEAVRTLSPYFLAHPQAFEGRMVTLVQRYFEAAHEAEREPDLGLLNPILPTLAALFR